MPIVISGTTGIDMGEKPVSNVSQLDSSTINENGESVINQGEIAYDVDTSSYIPNTLLSGAIIERGSNANGEYIKFADGTLICTYKAIVTDLAISTVYQSLFSGNRSWTLPHEFIEPPICKGDIVWGTGASWAMPYITTISMTTFVIVDAISRASGTSTKLSFIAIGRWK